MDKFSTTLQLITRPELSTWVTVKCESKVERERELRMFGQHASDATADLVQSWRWSHIPPPLTFCSLTQHCHAESCGEMM